LCGLQLREPDCQQFQEYQRIVIRFVEAPTLAQRGGNALGQVRMPLRQRGRQACPEHSIVGGIGQHQDVHAKATMLLQHLGKPLGEGLFQSGE